MGDGARDYTKTVQEEMEHITDRVAEEAMRLLESVDAKDLAERSEELDKKVALLIGMGFAAGRLATEPSTAAAAAVIWDNMDKWVEEILGYSHD